MKIALLFSGQLRTGPETIDHIIDYFGKYGHLDLYFSLAPEIGYVNQINDGRHRMGNRTFSPNYNVYDYRDILFTDYDEPDYGTRVRHVGISPSPECHILGEQNINLLKQYHKIWECIRAMPATKYDLVVRLRCDVMLQNEMVPCWDEIQDAIKSDKLIINKYVWANHESATMANEMFFMGNEKVMRKACNIYPNLHKIKNLIDEKVVQPFGESIFYGNLLVEGLAPDHLYKYDFDYTVIR